MIDQHDDKTIRCPRIGGEVNFRFCRFENNLLPCRFIIGCWQMQMDVNRLLEDHYSEEELARIFVPPRPKIESLLELIEKSKKVKEGDE